MERLEKPEEALILCEQAKTSEPTDDLTLSTLQIVFQRLGHCECKISITKKEFLRVICYLFLKIHNVLRELFAMGS